MMDKLVNRKWTYWIWSA